MKCPVCDSPMELVTVVRKTKGCAQAIKCPQCRTTTFLTKEAAARLQAASKAPAAPSQQVPEPAAASAAPGNSVPGTAPVPPAHDNERVPTSLVEDFIEWLNN